MSQRKKFQDQWMNQTNIGKLFGVSSIAVGKILVQNGLKEGKNATEKALKEGYATFTPLKDGTPFFLWNVSKVSEILAEKHKPLTEVEKYVLEIRNRLLEVERLYNSTSGTNHKLADITLELLYDDVPPKIKKEVRNIVENTQV